MIKPKREILQLMSNRLNIIESLKGINSVRTALLSLVFLVMSQSIVKAQNVNIPDADFKAKLVANNAINTNNSTSSMDRVTISSLYIYVV